MNKKELILDFIKWYVHHHVNDSSLVRIMLHQNSTVDEYLEMLETVEDLNDELSTWCIEFERELDGKEVIHVDSIEKPTEVEAIKYIKEEGYGFNDKYDVINEIYKA